MIRICLFSAMALPSFTVRAQEKPVVRMLDSVLMRNTIQHRSGCQRG